MNNELLYIHSFNLLPQFDSAKLLQVGNFFESFEQAFYASGSDLRSSGLGTELVDLFLVHRNKINIQEEQAKLEREGINLISFYEEGYPVLLKEISKPPALLYYKGTFGPADELCVAIVGTRKITNYGRVVAPYLAEPLIESGVTIVSGLAYGVDSTVQQIAARKNRRTIAILGGGLDSKSFYPKQHGLLADDIIEHGGCIISEYPPGTPPLKHHFVARNRIISGLSMATVVVECDLKSGSLITAKYALEQNRTVYAVPGPIYSEQSKGPNNLIKMGAKLVTEVNDILEDLNLKNFPEQMQVQSLFGDSPAESAILNILSLEPIAINELIKQSGLETGDATSALTFLEMKGKIRNLGGQQYVLSR